jgi:hypothetical protein
LHQIKTINIKTMSIKKSQIEDKSIRPNKTDTRDETDRLTKADALQEYNYPGQITIKAKSKEEADEKFKKLNK